MSRLAAILEAAEERVLGPLFLNRRPNQCAWPLWDWSTPTEQKRCCGGPVHPESRIPYCHDHLKAQRGTGTPSERKAAYNLTHMTNNGA